MVYKVFKMIKKIKSFVVRTIKNKDGKVLVSNFGYLMILQITSYIFPLITIPYLARVIGVEGFGKIAFAAAVVVWLKTVADWGFDYTATRDVARTRDNLEEVSKIFSNVLWARISLTLISLLLLLLLISIIPYFRENKEILLITFMLIPGHIFLPTWFFQAVEKMKYITIFDFFSKFFFTLLVFVFIKEKSDFILQPLFISLGYIVSGLFAMYIVTVRWGVKIYVPKPAIVLNTIKKSTDVFINNLLPNLYNSLSIILLGFLGGAAVNGIYDAGRKFVSIAHSFMTIITRVAFPFLSRKIESHDLFAKIYLSIAVTSSLTLFFLSPLLIKLFFTEEFYDAIIILKISSASIFFVGLSRVYGTNYLIIKGFTRKLRNITFFSSLFGLSISLPMVYYFEGVGAAIVLVFTQAILGLSVMYTAQSIKNRDIKSGNQNAY